MSDPDQLVKKEKEKEKMSKESEELIATLRDRVALLSTELNTFSEDSTAAYAELPDPKGRALAVEVREALSDMREIIAMLSTEVDAAWEVVGGRKAHRTMSDAPDDCALFPTLATVIDRHMAWNRAQGYAEGRESILQDLSAARDLMRDEDAVIWGWITGVLSYLWATFDDAGPEDAH